MFVVTAGRSLSHDVGIAALEEEVDDAPEAEDAPEARDAPEAGVQSSSGTVLIE
jgi:hypothetical protein